MAQLLETLNKEMIFFVVFFPFLIKSAPGLSADSLTAEMSGNGALRIRRSSPKGVGGGRRTSKPLYRTGRSAPRSPSLATPPADHLRAAESIIHLQPLVHKTALEGETPGAAAFLFFLPAPSRPVPPLSHLLPPLRAEEWRGDVGG